jgi:hypothetical protein
MSPDWKNLSGSVLTGAALPLPAGAEVVALLPHAVVVAAMVPARPRAKVRRFMGLPL